MKEDTELWHENSNAGDWDTQPTNKFCMALLLLLYQLQNVPWLSVRNFLV
jgi:hypothetical protein